MNILLPIAGKSSRFPNTRPKWMLTHPNGNLMIVEAIKGIAKDGDDIFIIYLKEHKDKFQFRDGLIENLKKSLPDVKLNFIELNDSTQHQVETVLLGLKMIGKDIPFLIKDCDNYFVFDREIDETKNHVMYATLDETQNTDPSSKSYIQVNDFGSVVNIVEKQVISNNFCCGGYFFKSSYEFIKKCKSNNNLSYVSDVIFSMSLDGSTFESIKCQDYLDWGTASEWNNYKDNFMTVFIDLDGVLFYNSSQYLKPYIKDASIIEENVNHIKQLVSTKNVELIITTARPEEYRSITENQLKDAGIIYKSLIMGLSHCKRVIVNDFSATNKYPSCESINILRNSTNLEDYL
jgi:hypothetical protein